MILRFNDYDSIIILPDDQTRFWAFQSTILWCRRIIHPVVGPVLVGGRLDPRLGVVIRVSDELPSKGAGSFPGATVASTDRYEPVPGIRCGPPSRGSKPQSFRVRRHFIYFPSRHRVHCQRGREAAARLIGLDRGFLTVRDPIRRGKLSDLGISSQVLEKSSTT